VEYQILINNIDSRLET